MDVSPLGLIRVILPQIPNLIKVALLALLHLSPTSGVQDISTQLVVALVRPILGTPAGLKVSQRQTTRDLPIRGPIWVSKVNIPRPEDEDHEGGVRDKGKDVCGILEGIEKVIRVLGDGTETFAMPTIENVEAEWNAYRPGASWLAARPKMEEKVQYQRMMKDVKTDAPTILYFHGGAFW